MKMIQYPNLVFTLAQNHICHKMTNLGDNDGGDNDSGDENSGGGDDDEDGGSAG